MWMIREIMSVKLNIRQIQMYFFGAMQQLNDSKFDLFSYLYHFYLNIKNARQLPQFLQITTTAVMFS